MANIQLIVPKRIVMVQPIAPVSYAAFLQKTVVDLAELAKESAQRETPVGATENLLKLISIKTNPFGISLEWFATHAAPVQHGFKKHWVPIEPLRLWAQAILGHSDNATVYRIREKLATRDTPGQYYIEKARKAVYARIAPLFKARMAFLRNLLQGD